MRDLLRKRNIRRFLALFVLMILGFGLQYTQLKMIGKDLFVSAMIISSINTVVYTVQSTRLTKTGLNQS